MKKPLTSSLLALLAGMLAFSCKSTTTEPTPSTPPKIETGTNVTATTQSVLPGGATVSVPSSDTALGGLEWTIPPHAFLTTQNVTISYAPIKSHQFGEFFHPISPLITISGLEGYADSVMTMKVPIHLPAGATPVAFFYDDATGKLEPIPMSRYDATSVTIMSMHFDLSAASEGTTRFKGSGISGVIRHYANILFSYATPQLVALIAAKQPIITTDPAYLPGVDDWEFINNGSYLPDTRNGLCAGQDLSALWYFYQKKVKLNNPPLYNRFDSVHAAQPDYPLWQDNPLGYRMAAQTQVELDWKTFSRFIYEMYVGTTDDWTWQTLVTSMYFGKEPYCMGLYGTKDGESVGHDVTAYSVNLLTREISVADPNHPGNLTRRIQYDGSNFLPYAGGLSAKDPGTLFPDIRFVSKSALINWAKIANVWKNVIDNGQNPGFPTYKLWVNNGGAELTDHYSTYEDSLDLSISWSEATNLPFFQVINRTGAQLVPDPTFSCTQRGTVKLQHGENIIGICMYGVVPPLAKPDILWNDFKWYHVFYAASSVMIQPSTLTGAKQQQYVWSGIVADRPKDVRYEWDFGDHSAKFIRTNDSVAYYSYPSDGDYTITLDAFDVQTSKKIGTATATASIHSAAQITSVYPTDVSYAERVYISGRNFGSTQGTSSIKFGTLTPKSVISWTDNEIVATVPEQFTGGAVTLTIGGTNYRSTASLANNPQITSTSPDSTYGGEIVTIRGKMFGYEQGHSVVVFGYVDTAIIVLWSDTALTVIVPDPSSQYYGADRIEIILGNGLERRYEKFIVIEDVYKTLHRLPCLSDVILSGMMNVYYPPPKGTVLEKNSISVHGYCQDSPLIWNGASFHYSYRFTDTWDTNVYSMDGTVSEDGKTILTLRAHVTTSDRLWGYTSVSDLQLQNVPLSASYAYQDRVIFGGTGGVAQQCVTSAKYERYRDGILIERYEGTDWMNATQPASLSITFD